MAAKIERETLSQLKISHDDKLCDGMEEKDSR